VVTCDTVTHPSNAISIDDALADAVGRLLMDDTAARSA
jgi:hypothetical protein